MRIRLRILGCTVLSVTVENAQWILQPEEPEDAPEGITGGSGMAFERDMDPPNPSREEPYWGEGRFGFCFSESRCSVKPNVPLAAETADCPNADPCYTLLHVESIRPPSVVARTHLTPRCAHTAAAHTGRLRIKADVQQARRTKNPRSSTEPRGFFRR